MSDYIYFKLQHKEKTDVELLGVIDIDTIDDDEPDIEYQLNDGLWGNSPSDYCKVNGREYYSEFQELKHFEYENWDIISQIIVDCGNIAIKMDDSSITFKREFDVCNLYVAYNRDFDHPQMVVLPNREIVGSDLNE